jgi:excisionase family DNA binding protein
MLTMQAKKFYTVEEVSETLGIHPHTVRSYIKQGVLKGVKKAGTFLILGTEVERFLKIKNEWLTMKELQNKLGISRVMVWHYIKKGKLKPTKLGRFLYFNPEEVEKLLETQKGGTRN